MNGPSTGSAPHRRATVLEPQVPSTDPAIRTALTRSLTVNFLELDQHVMHAQREASSRARESRLARLVRGGRGTSRAVQPVNLPAHHPVPLPR